MDSLQTILAKSASRHTHLCPRQVLGARIGSAGCRVLDLSMPRTDKRLLVIVESLGCFISGIESATGCGVGRRTLIIHDYGKTAATFVDTQTGEAIRITPLLDVREKSVLYAPDAPSRWQAQLDAYQIMPDVELLSVQRVVLRTPIAEILGRPGVRVNCAQCGEEIVNEREVVTHLVTLCKACADGGYYVAETGDHCQQQRVVTVDRF